MNDQTSRRTALKYLIGVVVSAMGTRVFANSEQMPLSAPFSNRAFPIALGQHVGVSDAAMPLQPAALAGSPTPTNFQRVYTDPKLRDRFYLFLQNVYHLYPENRFHQLILDLTAEYQTDQEIYQKLQARLPKIKPVLYQVTYGLPSLQKQKDEMARQTAELLGTTRSVKGYVEIGTTGRYVNGLRQRVSIEGPIYLVNDQEPAYSLEDIFERGQVTKSGDYVPMGNYDAFAPTYIPAESIDLVTNFIGFHHAPADRLEQFVQSIWNVLKPGGRMVVRDHDVDSTDMDAFVALAHDVFNAGLDLSWEQNHAQIRNFRSVPQLTAYLEKAGFERAEPLLFQDHDPTRNALMMFVKPGARTA
jgi:SAM-dependent methyltransferase